MKKVVVVFLLITLLGVVIYFAICNTTYSDGSRTGILMKFSREGYVFKTFEGDINVGFINTNVLGLTANVFHFSVKSSDKNVIEQLNKLENKQIKIYYKQKIKVMPWVGDTDFLIYNVERVYNN